MARRRRGGVPLDLQPHRALPRGHGSRGGRGARVAGAARRRGRALPDDRRGGGAAPVPGRGRSRLARSGRGRDPRPGARCVRGGRARAGARPVVPRGASRGKKVRTETAINESPASVSSAAAALAQQVFGDLDGCRVLLVGAGEVSELAARALAARGATIGAVTSRTQANAARLAEALRLARGSVRPARSGARPRGRRRLLDELVRSRSCPRDQVPGPEGAAAVRDRPGRAA